MKHLLFTSYEIHPVNPGGCGVFLWNAIGKILEDENFKVTLLLDIPLHECELFEKEHKMQLPNNENLNVVCLSQIIEKLSLNFGSFENIFLFKSYQFYKGIEKLVKNNKIDYIEFFDYVGIGYFTIRAKKFENKFKDTKIGIRAHCTTDLMDLEQNQIDFSKEKIEMYQMEKLALQDADFVILQSKSWDKIYMQRYNVAKEKIVVSTPPMNNHDFPKFNLNNESKNILFYGRIFQLKGIDQFIDAGILYLSRNKNDGTKFYIVGYNSKNYQGESYKDYLISRIPNEYKANFIFTGSLNRLELKKVLDDVKIAIFPNYVESFCYSIHEIYEAGMPIICRSIPAFDDYFVDSENCLKYNGSIMDLYRKIEMLLKDENLQRKLSFPYKVLNDIKFVDTYNYILSSELNGMCFEDVEDERISVIILDELENVNSEILNNEFISKKSYILNNKDEGNIEIEFLGRKLKISNITEENKDLALERYILIMNSSDNIEELFLKRGLRILKNTSASFVSSAFKDINGKVLFNKLDLLNSNVIEVYDYFQTVLMDFKKEVTIGDIFDFRFESCGQAEILSKEGYVIPEIYNCLSDSLKLNINMPNRILFEHRKSKNNEWEPFRLMHLNCNTEKKMSKEKEIYHEIRKRANSTSGFRGKLYKQFVDFIYKIMVRGD